METIPLTLEPYVSLGGIVGTVSFTVLIYLLFLSRKKFNRAILFGALASPGFYTLLFVLQGRGHDGTEFQEAQYALGFNYAGHSLDWLLFVLFICGIFLGVMKVKPNPSVKMIGRIIIGVILTIVFIGGLQVINNAIFDPIFQLKRI